MHPKVQRRYEQRLGASLDHGLEHTQEHRSWNRREFLRMTGLASLGASLMLGARPISAFAATPLLTGLANADCGDRILVMIRLKGGNDGLNMVIPRGNDEYYNIRPNIAIQESGLWGLSEAFGMPNDMSDLQPFWAEGRMKIIHNVGYPAANYSHFRSSDIWASASNSNEVVNTGWIGRWLENEFQAFNSAPPVAPPALQIGVQTNLIFRAMAGQLALSISNPREFYQIALTGQLYDTANLGNRPDESELAYVRGVANSAFRYSESIRDAYNNGANEVTYPDYYLADQLAIVARLIKGNLGSKVYMVTIDGFDTHAEQLTSHPRLLNAVASTVKAFYDDLNASGHGPNVLAMTFSEFGRTIFENGSLGTDHGTGAPMLIFGHDIGNGFHGTPPDLLDVDIYGDPVFSVDFRQAYATLLQNWLCVHPEVIQNVLGQPTPVLDGLLPNSSPPIDNANPASLLGHNPDGVTPGAIQIKYALKQKGPVRLTILRRDGSELRILVNTFQEKGVYTFVFKPWEYYLAPGQYLYRLEAGGRSYSRPVHW